jgi:two-component system, NtrC family, response regulator AtoC
MPVRDQLPPDEILFGTSAAMAKLKQCAVKVCATDAQVLLLGAPGTGKELVARWIHKQSRASTGQFVTVNCAAIPASLLESELFGYERGAFTGARVAKPGRVELAEQGTLFFDEIAELEISLQGKLLHFLQDGSFSRIGDTVQRIVHTRLICATSKDLEEQVISKGFRSDLFHRINVVQLRLPSLRERLEDLSALTEYYRSWYSSEFDKPADPLSPEMLAYFRTLNWRGNIRELANEMARYVLMGAEAVLNRNSGRGPLPRPAGKQTGTVPLKRAAAEVIRETEKRVILEALRANRWNRRKTAAALQISYRSLIYKIRNAGLAHRVARPAEPSRTSQPSI